MDLLCNSRRSILLVRATADPDQVSEHRLHLRWRVREVRTRRQYEPNIRVCTDAFRRHAHLQSDRGGLSFERYSQRDAGSARRDSHSAHLLPPRGSARGGQVGAQGKHDHSDQSPIFFRTPGGRQPGPRNVNILRVGESRSACIPRPALRARRKAS